MRSGVVGGAWPRLGGGVRLRAGTVLVALGIVVAPGPLTAQTGSAETGVGLGDLAWLDGSWVGEGPQGATAEIHYMEPAAGVLPALFRLLQDDRVAVLDAVTLRQEDDGMFMYVRHFDAALVPLEEEQALRLELVGREGDAFLFENTREGENPRRSRLERTANGFTSWSELARPDGSADTIFVAWRRSGSGRGAGPRPSAPRLSPADRSTVGGPQLPGAFASTSMLRVWSTSWRNSAR